MNFKKHANLYLRLLTLIIVFLELIVKPISSKWPYLLLLILVAGLDVWSYSPLNQRHRAKVLEYTSYLLFTLLGIVAVANPQTITIMYYYFMVVVTAETMVKQHPKQKHLIIIQFAIYFCAFGIPKLVHLDFTSWVSYVVVVLSPYTIQFWSTFLISYLYINLMEKNRAIDALNKELMTKVDQLQDYSTKIKELTLIEERQRISQNLHDMLGHSLIGLRLHLDALNHYIDTDAEKSHQILDKSKDIIDHSLIELRETVNELNETKELADLKKALEDLQSTISVTDEVKVDLKMYFDVNKLDISIKDLIYKTCQEFITNSIKHGHSSLITIKLRSNQGQMMLDLDNNGLTPTDFTASHGINGIKERVQKLNGNVEFSTNQPSGFKTNIAIPIGVK